MNGMIFMVIAACTDGDNFYVIDSVWTSSKKAWKRCEKLNSVGTEKLMETRSCGLFEVKQKFVSH